jgi:hypothetical protein
MDLKKITESDYIDYIQRKMVGISIRWLLKKKLIAGETILGPSPLI